MPVNRKNLPVTGIVGLADFNQREFRLESRTETSAVYVYDGPEARIQKVFDFALNDYLIDITINIERKREMSSLDINNIEAFRLDISRLDKKLKSSRDLSLFEYSALIDNKVHAKGNIVKYAGRDEKFIFGNIKDIEKTGNLQWLGFRNRYFAFILSPRFINNGYSLEKTSDSTLNQSITVNPDKNNSFKFKAYYGPQNLAVLRESGENFDKIMRFSGIGIFDAVAKGIYFVLNTLHKFIPSWGLCIILLGVLIYGITYPLTLKSMASMKKMQSLQPEIAKLKEKYKDNPQRLSKEQMELFKEHKINPMGGCFPIILQMPVFIGFYQVLWRSVMLKGASFLWIKDLSQPDRAYIFARTYPLIGNELNILPFLMGIIMFFQQKISQKNMNVTDATQASQQKMMMIFLPIMMLFIFYHAASGLTLYFTFFYLLTIFTQWRISKVNN